MIERTEEKNFLWMKYYSQLNRNYKFSHNLIIKFDKNYNNINTIIYVDSEAPANMIIINVAHAYYKVNANEHVRPVYFSREMVSYLPASFRDKREDIIKDSIFSFLKRASIDTSRNILLINNYFDFDLFSKESKKNIHYNIFSSNGGNITEFKKDSLDCFKDNNDEQLYLTAESFFKEINLMKNQLTKFFHELYNFDTRNIVRRLQTSNATMVPTSETQTGSLAAVENLRYFDKEFIDFLLKPIMKRPDVILFREFDSFLTEKEIREKIDQLLFSDLSVVNVRTLSKYLLPFIGSDNLIRYCHKFKLAGVNLKRLKKFYDSPGINMAFDLY
jgi:hypothetical protein